ncbi:MAG TPA: hypothetical protein VKR58_06145 [Aquella sp.]|nr:hypothetical protein [Aquella sp.]
MPYKAPQNTTSIAANSSYSKNTNPYGLIPNDYAHDLDDKIRFRILSLEADQGRTIWGKKLEMQSKKTGKVFSKLLETSLLQGDPNTPGQNLTLKENNLNQLPNQGDDLKSSCYYRIPAWIYSVKNKKGDDVCDKDNNPLIEEGGMLMYLQLSWGLFDTIVNKLAEDKNVDFTFNEKTGLPDYDIVIHRAGSKLDTWDIYGVYMQDDKKTIDPHYGKEVPVVLKKHMENIDLEWDDLQESMNDFMSQEEINKTINYSRGNKSGGRTAMASRPTDNSAEDVEVEEIDDNAADETVETPVRTSKFRSRK